MQITRVRTKKVENSENQRLLGVAEVTVDDAIAIHGIKIIKGEHGRFVAFPSTRRLNKETNNFVFEDSVHPVNQETRDKFEKAILDEFDKLEG